jgi:hypothetical protein
MWGGGVNDLACRCEPRFPDNDQRGVGKDASQSLAQEPAVTHESDSDWARWRLGQILRPLSAEAVINQRCYHGPDPSEFKSTDSAASISVPRPHSKAESL